jgi:uncharacterized membrane-anchored protein
MAESNKPKTVKVFIDRGASHEDPNHYVSVNGKNFILPRGQESEVPEYVAEEIYRSRRAEARYNKTREAELKKAQENKLGI